ncbi:MAG: hypothetical protein LUG98_14125, partial [Tannerellaceae bacterium]|nr:hypothetical protein [Tannerellaceae bacterium]
IVYMTLLERRAELAKAILNDMDEEILSKLESAYYSISLDDDNSPCQYTPEEIKQRALESVEHMHQGLGISHEQMKTRHLS